jgi:hypothetical protein
MEKGTKALMTAQPRFHKQFKAVQKRPPDLKKTRQEKHLTEFQQLKKKAINKKLMCANFGILLTTQTLFKFSYD